MFREGYVMSGAISGVGSVRAIATATEWPSQRHRIAT